MSFFHYKKLHEVAEQVLQVFRIVDSLSSALWKTKQSQSMSLGWWWMTHSVHIYTCTPPSLTLFCITDTTATIFIWPDLLDLLTEEVGRVSNFRWLGTHHITGSDNKPKNRLTNYLCHGSTCCTILIFLIKTLSEIKMLTDSIVWHCQHNLGTLLTQKHLF